MINHRPLIIFVLLYAIVLVGLSCGKSAKAKCKEKYFAYRKDFPDVFEIKDTVTLNECIARLDEVLACVTPADFEYMHLTTDRRFLIQNKPLIVYNTPRNYSVNQLQAYAKGFDLYLDSNVAYPHYYISTPYQVEDLVKQRVSLDASIEYTENMPPSITFDLRFESIVNGRTVNFIELRQDTFSLRHDHFILMDFEGLSDFSTNPMDMLFEKPPSFTYGTMHPDFEHNELLRHLTTEKPLEAIWGDELGDRTTTIPADQVEELIRLIAVYQRMRTGQP